jgi:hypothetical protein
VWSVAEGLRHRSRRFVPAALALGLVVAVGGASALWLTTGDPRAARPPSGAASVAPPPTTVPAWTPSAMPAASPTPVVTVPPEDPGPAGAPRQPAAGRPGTPTPSPTSEQSLLQRVGPVPEGVADQVDFFLGGDQICPSDGEPGPPAVGGLVRVAEIPREGYLCFENFDPFAPLDLTVTVPGGGQDAMTLPPTGSTEQEFIHAYFLLPGSSLGAYRVHAEQGDLSVSAEFTVRRASRPLMLVHAEGNRPGIDVDVYLGGYPARRTATLHLYGGEQMRYRTSFTVPVDAHGEAHAVIDTRRGDPTGCYGVSSPEVYDSSRPALTTFCIF